MKDRNRKKRTQKTQHSQPKVVQVPISHPSHSHWGGNEARFAMFKNRGIYSNS